MYNEFFMVWPARIDLFGCERVPSCVRLGKSYEPVDIAYLTGKWLRILLQVRDLVATRENTPVLEIQAI